MKRTLFAAGLIALSQTASAGPIGDRHAVCLMKVLETAQRCIDDSSTHAEELACKTLGHDSIHACNDAANAALAVNPENW